MSVAHEEPLVTIHHGDCREVMAAMPEASVDAIVCDPPYGLEFMGKEWDRLGVYSGGNPAMKMGTDQPVRASSHNGGVSYGSRAKNPRCTRCGKYQFAPQGRGCICTDGGSWDYRRDESGFQMQAWYQTWATAALRVAKPGAHLLAFGGTRTHHRLMVALEDAGWEIRDCLMWLYGSGFSKSWNFGNRYDGGWCSCGDAVQYSHANHSGVRGLQGADGAVSVSSRTSGEAHVLPLLQREAQGSGLDSSQREHERPEAHRQADGTTQSVVEGRDLHRAGEGVSADSDADTSSGQGERVRPRASGRRREDAGSEAAAGRGGTPQESGPSGQPAGEPGSVRDPSGPLDEGTLRDGGRCPRCRKLKAAYKGFGTGLKPAWEVIVLARKPLAGTVAANVERWGTGALNIDGCRIGFASEDDKAAAAAAAASQRASRDQNANRKAYGRFENGPESIGPYLANLDRGRWPANLVLDEAAAAMLDEQSGELHGHGSKEHSGSSKGIFDWGVGRRIQVGGESGGASRFFYTAKADREDRDGSKHPTVKPVALMKWLLTLVTPPDGVALDPFLGSGTTCYAARALGLRSIGIEQDAAHVAEAIHRLRQGVLV